MAIDSKHPQYLEVETDYRVMRDTYAGQRRIKEATFLYLPPTNAHVLDGVTSANPRAPGWIAYQSYIGRAKFPDHVKEAVKTLTGVMHSKAAVIELPAALEPMRQRATRNGDTLDQLLRWMNEHQLRYGRLGLLLDFPADPRAAELAGTPHVVQYEAPNVINWDDQAIDPFSPYNLNLVVADETLFARGHDQGDIFDWDEQSRFRVAVLEPENESDGEPDPTAPLVYRTFVEQDNERSEVITPMFRGKTLDFIPWVFVGANDLNSKPDEIPLLGLAELSIIIYQADADYRNSLHVQGQDTLVIVGIEIGRDGEELDETEQTRVGAGAVIRLQAGEGVGAKFIGIDSKGLPEQAKALEAENKRAEQLGARLLEQRGAAAESGEALRIRVSASTSSLRQVALTGAAGLEMILRMAATWVGANPDEVKVTPNIDFAQNNPPAEMARSLAQAKKDGFPISLRSMHKWSIDRGFTELPFEEELAEIESEPNLGAEQAAAAVEAVAEVTPEPTEPEPGEGDGPPADDAE